MMHEADSSFLFHVATRFRSIGQGPNQVFESMENLISGAISANKIKAAIQRAFAV